MRHVALVVVLISALMFGPVGVAFPNGIGEQGDGGCLCHGGPSLEDTIHLHGWPETYTPGQTYLLHVNASVSEDLNGGFRLLVNDGNLTANATSTAQAMEDGLTHTAPSSISDGWTAVWVAPTPPTERFVPSFTSTWSTETAPRTAIGGAALTWLRLAQTTKGPSILFVRTASLQP